MRRAESFQLYLLWHRTRLGAAENSRSGRSYYCRPTGCFALGIVLAEGVPVFYRMSLSGCSASYARRASAMDSRWSSDHSASALTR